MRYFLALALLSPAVAAPAFAESFSRDGIAYEYRVIERNGYQLITGSNKSTGEAFRLRVDGQSVVGSYGGSPVRFRTGATATASSGAAVFAAK